MKLRQGIAKMVMSVSKGNQWVERWFVAKDGILFKYDSKGATTPSAKYPLYKCQLEEYSDPTITDSESIQYTFRITAKQNFIILQAPTEEEMHLWLNAIRRQQILMEQIIDDIEL